MLKEDSNKSRLDSIEMAVAALLIEVSRADHSLDDSEKQKIKAILIEQLGLNHEDIDALFELAEAEVEEAISLYQFTQLINQHYGYDDKILLVLSMWKVAYADGELDKYEDYLIRKVTELIYVSHSDFIQQKLKAANERAVK